VSPADASQEASLDHVDEAGVNGAAGVDPAADSDTVVGSVVGGNGKPGFLSDVIVELGFLDATVVEEAEEEARQLGRSLPQVLLDRGELTEEQLARSIAARNGLDYVDLNEFEVDLGAAELIDTSAARRYKAVPIAFDPTGELVIAIADPVDALAVMDIAVITKSKVRTVVASASAIEAVIACVPEGAPRPPTTDESLPREDPGEDEGATRVARPDGAEQRGGDVASPVEVPQLEDDAIGHAGKQARSGAVEAIGPHRLQERIIQLVESALDGAAESEVSTLEAELTKAQQGRGILEAELTKAQQGLGSLEAELDAERQAREALEEELDAERQAREAVEEELERERESRSTETKALMVEREEWVRERDELERGIRERVAVASEKSAELERLLTDLQAETTRADHRS
jgi:MshEN domain